MIELLEQNGTGNFMNLDMKNLENLMFSRPFIPRALEDSNPRPFGP